MKVNGVSSLRRLGDFSPRRPELLLHGLTIIIDYGSIQIILNVVQYHNICMIQRFRAI